MKPVMLNDWLDCTPSDVFDAFGKSRWDDDGVYSAVPIDAYGIELLLASYAYDPYSGYAFVLFRRDGKLWEVNASHCSCFGLEHMWDPEETTVEALLHRLDHGTLGLGDGWRDHGGKPNVFAAELREVLQALAAEGGQ